MGEAAGRLVAVRYLSAEPVVVEVHERARVVLQLARVEEAPREPRAVRRVPPAPRARPLPLLRGDHPPSATTTTTPRHQLHVQPSSTIWIGTHAHSTRPTRLNLRPLILFLNECNCTYLLVTR